MFLEPSDARGSYDVGSCVESGHLFTKHCYYPSMFMMIVKGLSGLSSPLGLIWVCWDFSCSLWNISHLLFLVSWSTNCFPHLSLALCLVSSIWCTVVFVLYFIWLLNVLISSGFFLVLYMSIKLQRLFVIFPILLTNLPFVSVWILSQCGWAKHYWSVTYYCFATIVFCRLIPSQLLSCLLLEFRIGCFNISYNI